MICNYFINASKALSFLNYFERKLKKIGFDETTLWNHDSFKFLKKNNIIIRVENQHFFNFETLKKLATPNIEDLESLTNYFYHILTILKIEQKINFSFKPTSILFFKKKYSYLEKVLDFLKKDNPEY